jgi:hypothetical protein
MVTDKYTSIIQTSNNDSLVIDIPEAFKSRQVRVTVEIDRLSKEEKIKRMQLAENDPLYKSDMEEISADFIHIDNENL